MGGIVGVQQGQQYMHEMLRPVGHHVVMHLALQGMLEAFHHGTFDVAILTGEEMNDPRIGQSLESTHFGPLVTLHGQQQFILHLIQDGLHGTLCCMIWLHVMYYMLRVF